MLTFYPATWIEHHFTDDIQTRQYRCPEVILGAKWGDKLRSLERSVYSEPFSSIAPIVLTRVQLFELITGGRLSIRSRLGLAVLQGR